MAALPRQSAQQDKTAAPPAPLGRQLDMFLNPRSVAVIGASDDPARIGGRTIFNLKRGGFEGPVYPINPGRQTVQGLKAYPGISAIPELVDCAVIALPGELVLPAVEECIAKGVRGVVIFSAGFNEAGLEGERRQRHLGEIVANSGMRVVGPNCLGMFNANNGAWLSFTTQFQERVAGPLIGMVSQSGGSAAHILRLAQDRGLAINAFITTGNEVDVDFGEGLQALAAHSDTKVILAYIEGIRDAAHFLAGLEVARAARKPVITLKVGRTLAGAAAAASHTASLAGEDRVYDAVFRRYGVCRARSTEDLLDVAYAAAEAPALPSGNRLGVVTISGGMGAQIADAADDVGLVIPTLDDASQDRLRELCPVGAPANPVDITAQVSTDPGLFGASLRVILESGACDMIFAFVGVYAGVPTLSERILLDLTALRADYPDVPIALGVACRQEVTQRYREAGFLVFEEPARGVRALGALRDFAVAFDRPATEPASLEGAPIVEKGSYSEAAAKTLIAAAGIRSPKERACATPSEVEQTAIGLRFPIALKILSPDILHKTEIGGVALGIADAREASAAAEAMLARVVTAAPHARIEGFLLSEMAPPGVELILGTRIDPVLGPLVIVGLGGVTAELFEDVAISLAPVDAAEARSMIGSLRAYPLLDGYRGAAKADVAAVVDAIVNLSRLAAANAAIVATMEINPLRVLPTGEGALALDAVVETFEERS